MTEISLRKLFVMSVEVAGPAQIVGATPLGYTRRIMNVSGGRFEGERLSGRILPGGADWVMVRPDGALHLDVRLTLETDSGALIYLTYTGRRNGPPDILARIARAEQVPPGSDYFRIALAFETAAPDLAWLNDIIAIGAGSRPPQGPVYDVYEVR